MCILNMPVVKNSLSLNNLINWTLCFLPISFILGSLLININIMLVVLIGFLSIRSEKLKSNFDKIDAILLIFFIYYIFVTALNINLVGEKMLIKAFLLLRFLGLYLVLKVLIENNKINLNNFFKVCLICTSFVSIDLLIQFFYGKDIFGITPHEGRLTGVFGYEAIAGGYVQKLFLILREFARACCTYARTQPARSYALGCWTARIGRRRPIMRRRSKPNPRQSL